MTYEAVRNYLLNDLPSTVSPAANIHIIGGGATLQPNRLRTVGMHIPKPPEVLGLLASDLQRGNRAGKEKAITWMVSLFDNIWYDSLPDFSDNVKVPDLQYCDVIGKPVRLVTPRYVSDVAELSDGMLAVIMAGPRELASELKRLVFAKAQQGKVLYQTPIQLCVKCEGYMFEAFCYTEVAATGADL